MAELPEEQCFEFRSQSHDGGVSGSARRMKTNDDINDKTTAWPDGSSSDSLLVITCIVKLQ